MFLSLEFKPNAAKRNILVNPKIFLGKKDMKVGTTINWLRTGSNIRLL
jgi:hypothetical protein